MRCVHIFVKVCRICSSELKEENLCVHSIYKGHKIFRNVCLSCKKNQDNEGHRKNRHRNIRKFMLRSTMNRAKKKSIEFNLTIDDIVVPENCPILGISLNVNDGFAKDNSPSIDRIDPSKGYVKGNCCVISYKANRMKQENTLEDLLKIINYIKNSQMDGV